MKAAIELLESELKFAFSDRCLVEDGDDRAEDVARIRDYAQALRVLRGDGGWAMRAIAAEGALEYAMSVIGRYRLESKNEEQ